MVLHLFVLTLGYSRRHYMEPALNERVPQFLDAHERAFDHSAGTRASTCTVRHSCDTET